MTYYPGQILSLKRFPKQTFVEGSFPQHVTSAASHSLPAFPLMISLTTALPGAEERMRRSEDEEDQIAHLRPHK